MLEAQCRRWRECSNGALRMGLACTRDLQRSQSLLDVWIGSHGSGRGLLDWLRGGNRAATEHQVLRRRQDEGWVKGLDRAVEKVLTCYGGDGSRLLDLCRGRIGFRNLEDIAACLKAMLEDHTRTVDSCGEEGGPRLVRVKNLMPTENGDWDWRNAGYSAVVVNFRFDTEKTRHLGLDLHIAEVILVLDETLHFQRILKEAGHKRYRAFRTMRSYLKQLPRAVSCGETDGNATFPSPLPPAFCNHTVGCVHPKTLGSAGSNEEPKAAEILETTPLSECQERRGNEFFVLNCRLSTDVTLKSDFSHMHNVEQNSISNSREQFVKDTCLDQNISQVIDSGPCLVRYPERDDLELTMEAQSNDPGCNEISKSKEKSAFSNCELCALTDVEPKSSSGSRIRSNLDLGEATSGECERYKLRVFSAGSSSGRLIFTTPDLKEQMLTVFTWSIRASGDALDQRRKNVNDAVSKASAGSALFSSKPIQAGASKPVIQFLFFLLSCFFFYRFSLSVVIANSMSGSGFQAQKLRMEVLELRDQVIPRNRAKIGSLGLMLDGCTVMTTLQSPTLQFKQTMGKEKPWESRESAVFELDAGRIVSANGYFWVTDSNSSASADPVRWILYAQSAQLDKSSTNSTPWDVSGGEWTPVGASGWLLRFGGDLELFPQIRYETPNQRGSKVLINMRMPWPEVAAACTGTIEWALALLACSMAGCFGQTHCLYPILLFTTAADLMMLLVCLAGTSLIGDWRISCKILFYTVTTLVAFVGLIKYEAQVVKVFFFYGLSALVLDSTLLCAIYPGSFTAMLFEVAPSEGTASIFFGTVVLFLRKRAVSRARAVIKQDLKMYQGKWEELCRCSDVSDRLCELQEIIKQGQIKHSSGGSVRQYSDICVHQKNISSSLNWNSSWRSSRDFARADIGRRGSWLAAPRERQPVKSLDQLFMQALLLHPILLLRVQTWASACNGMFVLRREWDGQREAARFGRWEDPEVPRDEFKFAKVKSVHRAVEKIERSYGEDASNLVDLCRQCIIVESVKDVCDCYRAISSDPTVALLRVKNRLDPAYNASQSGGYRDVALNLQLTTHETLALGLDQHVCEIQILLRAFAELKSDEGHQRYVAFRQLRGE